MLSKLQKKLNRKIYGLHSFITLLILNFDLIAQMLFELFSD